MLLSLGLIAALLAIALFQATQGLFSALIMAVLTVCCAAAAFGWYEWVAVHWVAPITFVGLSDYALSISLALLFGVPLIILRLISDRVIRRSGLVAAWLDRFGGGLCGLVTGATTVGVAANALLWIPHGTSIMGFSRGDFPSKVKENQDAPDPTPPVADAPLRELLLTPDRFAAGFCAQLSDGIFSGSRSLKGENPDLVTANAWLTMVSSEVSRYAKPKSIGFKGSELVPFVYREIPGESGGGGRRGREPQETGNTYEPISPQSGHEFRMVRVQLNREALDSRKSHTFTLRQFRLMGRDAEKTPRQFHAMAIQQNRQENAPLDPVNRHIKIQKTRFGDWHMMDQPFSPRGDNNAQVEVVFEVPKGFIPDYVEYKRGARVAVSFDTPKVPSTPQDEPKKEPDDDQTAAPPTSTSPATGGALRRYAVRKGKSFFGDDLPMELRAYQKVKDGEARRGKMSGGHLVGYVDEQEGGKNEAVKRFDVPEDKRLLQLNVESVKARSTLGKAKSFAMETLQNFFVIDGNGGQHEVIGKYAVADIDGRQVVEVQYFKEKTGTIGQLGKFNKIKDDHLKGEYELYYLFLVDPGVQIVAFSAGGDAGRREDLGQENLVAPE